MVDKNTEHEQALRERGDVGVDNIAQEIIEQLTGISVVPEVATDVAGAMRKKTKMKRPYIRNRTKSGRVKAQIRRTAKKVRENRLLADERRLAELKAQLQAGDPNAPNYAVRLASAKKSIGLSVSLPHIARQKWNNPEFQQKMFDRGFTYDPAKLKGWMPFDLAKRVQKEVLGAKSRGEYEFYIKLFNILFLPARPDAVYTQDWQGWSDFLGTINVFGFGEASIDPANYRPFYEALSFVRGLKLKTAKQWQKACKDGTVPLDIPVAPHKVYGDQFVSIEHWLGSDTGLDKIVNKAGNDSVWVLYTDGRPDAFWWAKMSTDKYDAFSKLDAVQIARVYVFEGHLADKVWQTIEAHSEQYEDDRRERFISAPTVVGVVRSELDAILQWSNV